MGLFCANDNSSAVEYLYEPPRCKSKFWLGVIQHIHSSYGLDYPEPFKVLHETCGRSSSLDSGVLLNVPANVEPSQVSVRGTPILQSSEPHHDHPSPVTLVRVRQ